MMMRTSVVLNTMIFILLWFNILQARQMVTVVDRHGMLFGGTTGNATIV